MNNSASAILECITCGHKRQAVTLVLRKRPCPVCGGVIRAAGARPAGTLQLKSRTERKTTEAQPE